MRYPVVLTSCLLLLLAACGGSASTSKGADGGPTQGGSRCGSPDVHLTQAASCPYDVAPDGGVCQHDSDCTGTCGVGVAEHCFTGRCTCDECESDTDCASSGQKVCSCNGQSGQRGGAVGNVCVSGDCRTDADCGKGWCSPTTSACTQYGVVGYYCHQPGDACLCDSDCAGDGSAEGTCRYDDTVGKWACSYGLVCSG